MKQFHSFALGATLALLMGADAQAAPAVADLPSVKAPVQDLRYHQAPAQAPAEKSKAGVAVAGGNRAAPGKLRMGLGQIAAAARVPLQGTSSISPSVLKSVAPMARFGTNASGRTYVHTDISASPGAVAALKATLTSLGADRISSYGNLVSARVPVTSLDALGGSAHVRFARPSMARTNRGTYESQGDFAMGATAVRAPAVTGGPTGLGVKVGVLSDSFGCRVTSPNATDDIGTNEFSAVTVLQDETGCGSGTDEGRAMLQVVADVAPDSTQLFHTAFDGEADFAAGIVALRNAGADVVVDDVTYFDEPYFEDGIVAQAAQYVHDNGGTYFSSAGNSSTRSYEADWNPATAAFVSVAPGDGNSGPAFNFDLSNATQTTVNSISIPNAGHVSLWLQWDSPFFTGSTAASPAGTPNFVNLYLVRDSDGAILDSSVAENGGTFTGGDPVSVVDFTNTSGAAVAAHAVIELATGSAPTHLKWINFGNTNSFTKVTTAPNNGPAVGHPAAAGAMSIGAAPFYNTANCGVAGTRMESFSSWGGTKRYFNTDDTRLASPLTRQKPDVVGPDGGNTSFFGQVFNITPAQRPIVSCQDQDGLANNFFGTSESAPHAAGLAALMKQAAPYATPDQVYAAMRSTAEDMVVGSTNIGATAGYDTQTGFGFLRSPQALAAVIDTTPDDYNFTAQSGAALNQTVQSNSVTVTGITAPAAISISGGSYRINGGTAQTTTSTVALNDQVRVSLLSSSSGNTLASATLTIGGVVKSFDVTTGAASVDLSLNQSASANPTQTGSSITYTLTVHDNSATDGAAGLVLTETLAAGLTYNSFNSSDAWSCSAAGQIVTCNLATIAAASSSTVDITAGVGSTAGSIKTTGTVSANPADPLPANNNKAVTTLLCDTAAVDSIAFGSSSFAGIEDAPVTIVVNRIGNSCTSATVHYATTAGGSAPAADFTATSGDFTWLPLDANKKTFTVILNNDSIFTGNRTVGLALSSPSGNATLTKASSLIAIKDDEVPVTLGLSTSDQSVSEEGGVATVTATLSGARGVDTTVPLTVTGTANKIKDYTLSATSILIPAGQLAGSVTLTGLTDLLDEANETAIVKMGTVNGVTTSGTTTNTVTFTDDDATPTVSFDTAASTKPENKANAVTLVLSAASGQDVTVNVSSTGGSATAVDDYSINGSGTVTILAGATSATAVRIVDDAVHESSETAVFQIDSATNATPGGIQSTTLTITDNDP